MLVRDEATVLGRCIESVRPVIDSYFIIDTGSQDNTIQILKEKLAGLSGNIVSQPFSSFAQLRQQSYAGASQLGEIILFLDADETLAITERNWHIHPDLQIGILDVDHLSHTLRQHRLVRPGLDIYCHGYVREQPVISEGLEPQNVRGLKIVHHEDGFRSRLPDLHRAESLHLQATLGQPSRDAATYLALARAADAAGEDETANYYLGQCIDLEPDSEIRWQALYLFGQINSDTDHALTSFAEAFELCPDRAEPLRAMSQILQQSGKPDTAARMAELADEIAIPEHALYLEKHCYRQQ